MSDIDKAINKAYNLGYRRALLHAAKELNNTGDMNFMLFASKFIEREIEVQVNPLDFETHK